MKDTEKVMLVKQLFGRKGDCTELTDAEVNPFLTVAKSIILTRLDPFGSTSALPSKYDILQCQIANALLVKQGAEGEIQHTENGVTCIYGQADVPDALLRQIVPKAGVFGKCVD